ncbi:flagellar biosynthesis protein FliQ [Salmonella enterica subsp. enterica serovar Typhimurium]|nr:flagellar biosynthesis protein FliQ [Salmonella enterica subsp. enterica serovar Typhimurium]
MQVSGALIGIIALILAAAWVIKRMGFAPKGNSVRGLKVSASASLGPRERVVIVEVENARLVLAAPLLLVALITGLIISILQAATQINEMTLSFIPKIVAVFIAIIVAGPWMLNLLLDYVRTLFSNLPYIIG